MNNSKKDQLKNLLSREEKQKILKVFDRPLPPKNTPNQVKDVKSMLVEGKSKSPSKEIRWIQHRKSNAFLENFHSFQIGGKALDNLLKVNDIEHILKFIAQFPNATESQCKEIVNDVMKLSSYNPIFTYLAFILEKLLIKHASQSKSKEKIKGKWILLGNDKKRISKSMVRIREEVDIFEKELNLSRNSVEVLERIKEENEILQKQKEENELEILKLQQELFNKK